MSNSTRKKTYPETLKPQPRLKCYLYHNFFFSLSILLSRFKNLSFIFPCIRHHLVQCQHSHALYGAHVHPTSERDITDTQSRYANRKSYITMNCRRAFQIWRITDIDKKETFTNVEIIPLPVLRYFILRPSLFRIRSFLLVSVSLFRLNSSRRETVTFVLVFVWCSWW